MLAVLLRGNFQSHSYPNRAQSLGSSGQRYLLAPGMGGIGHLILCHLRLVGSCQFIVTGPRVWTGRGIARLQFTSGRDGRLLSNQPKGQD